MTEIKGDLISRETLKKDIEKRCGEPFDYIKTIVPTLKAIDNAPTVEAKQGELLDYIKLSLEKSDELKEKYRNKHKESNSQHDLYYSHLFEGMAEAYDDLLKKMGESDTQGKSKQGEWIPIVMRPGTDEEYEDFCRYGDCPREDFRVFDCPTPDDEQEVFVTTRWGNVCIDIWHRDVDCCYFEDNCDDGDVIAWMPIPKPYKESEADK